MNEAFKTFSQLLDNESKFHTLASPSGSILKPLYGTLRCILKKYTCTRSMMPASVRISALSQLDFRFKSFDLA